MLIALALVSVSLGPSCLIVTERDVTRLAVMRVFTLMNQYAKNHGSLPASLDALPRPTAEFNYLSDGWGRPLGYRVDPDGIVTVFSYGRSGRPGSADYISQSCYWKRKDGSFWAASDGWYFAARVPDGADRTVPK